MKIFENTEHINFENIEHLAKHILETTTEDEESVTVVADRWLITDLLGELLTYEKVDIGLAYMHPIEDYEDEYMLTVYYNDDEGEDWYEVSVEPAKIKGGSHYLSADGYVLLHETVNSRIQLDMEKNVTCRPDRCDWFSIDDEYYDDDFDIDNTEKEIAPQGKAEKAEHGKNANKGDFESEFAKLFKEFSDFLFRWQCSLL